MGPRRWEEKERTAKEDLTKWRSTFQEDLKEKRVSWSGVH